MGKFNDLAARVRVLEAELSSAHSLLSRHAADRELELDYVDFVIDRWMTGFDIERTLVDRPHGVVGDASRRWPAPLVCSFSGCSHVPPLRFGNKFRHVDVGDSCVFTLEEQDIDECMPKASASPEVTSVPTAPQGSADELASTFNLACDTYANEIAGSIAALNAKWQDALLTTCHGDRELFIDARVDVDGAVDVDLAYLDNDIAALVAVRECAVSLVVDLAGDNYANEIAGSIAALSAKWHDALAPPSTACHGDDELFIDVRSDVDGAVDVDLAYLDNDIAALVAVRECAVSLVMDISHGLALGVVYDNLVELQDVSVSPKSLSDGGYVEAGHAGDDVPLTLDFEVDFDAELVRLKALVDQDVRRLDELVGRCAAGPDDSIERYVTNTTQAIGGLEPAERGAVLRAAAVQATVDSGFRFDHDLLGPTIAAYGVGTIVDSVYRSRLPWLIIDTFLRERRQAERDLVMDVIHKLQLGDQKLVRVASAFEFARRFNEVYHAGRRANDGSFTKWLSGIPGLVLLDGPPYRPDSVVHWSGPS